MVCSISTRAQDIHLSQPYINLIFQNPAFTGINVKFSFNSNYHDQWNAISNLYKTYIVSGDYRFNNSKIKNTTLCAGGLLYNDVAGDGSYRTTNLGMTVSCLVNANEKIKLSGGLGYNIVQSAVNQNNYSWASQFNGRRYDPSIPSGEKDILASKWYSDINAGIAMIYKENGESTNPINKSKLILGYSINHFNRPDISINNNKNSLFIKQVVFINAYIPLKNKNIAFKPTLLFYNQHYFYEVTVGSLVRYTIGDGSQITGLKKESAISIGAFYRVKDAIIPTLQVEKGNFLIGLSYDINVSMLATGSNYRGGFEISLSLTDATYFLFQKKN
jgi:type IX secretion system PorP/SprF family membrane protein